MDTKNKTALVTGASAGIGFELAKIFARNGYDLVLIARDEERLNTIAGSLGKDFGITAHMIAADLSQSSASETIFNKTKALGVNIDVLVNNAGFGTYGPFIDAPLAGQLGMITLNIAALTELTHRYLREMKKRGGGKILNVASTAAFQPGPLMAVYYATKAYVLSFSEAIRNEVRPFNITVTTLCPGPTRTDFTKKEPSLESSRLFSLQKPASAEVVAQAGYRALMKNKTYVIPGFRNKLGAFLTRLGPRDLITKISRSVLEQ